MATDLNKKLNLDAAINNLDTLIQRVETLNSSLGALNKTTADTEKQQEDLNKAQNDSKKIVEDLTTEEIQLAKLQDQVVKTAEKLTGAYSDENVQLQKNKIELAAANKEIKDRIKAEKDAEATQNTLNKALKVSAKTIKEAEVQNRALRKAVKQVDTTTEAGQKRIQEYNAVIEQNDALINQTSDSFIQQKRNIGNYASALEGIKGGFDTALTSIGNYASGLEGIKGGFDTALTSAKAFIANPIAAIVAGLAAVFGTLSKAIGRSEKASAAFNKVGAIFSGIFNGLLEVLTPVVEVIGEGLVKAFNDPLGAIKDLGTAILENLINRFKAIGVFGDAIVQLFSGEFSKAAESFANASIQISTGVENAIEKGKGLIQVIKDTTAATIAVANAERDRVKAAIEFEKSQLRNQKLAEDQRQIRDDESKSIAERIAANEKLGQILDNQLQKELALAKEQLKLAQDQQIAQGETLDTLQEIGDAEIRILEIEERIGGQRSEQLVNTNSLLRDQLALTKEQGTAELDNIQKVIDAEEAQRVKEEEDLEAEQEADIAAYLNESEAKDKKAADDTKRAKDSAEAQKGFISDVAGFGLDTAADAFGLEKEAAIGKALINTYEGVTKALAQGGVFGIASGALVAAAGAIQIAKISGVGAFFKGTKNAPKGPAFVSERGPELIEDQNGNLTLVPDMSLINLKGGETIHTAQETKQMMFDDSGIIKELRKQKTTVIVNLNPDSFISKYRMKA